VAFLVDGYVGGPGSVSLCRRQFPDHFLHYHRAGHGAVTSRQSKRGYSVLAHMKMARLQGASGIHTGTMGFGKMEGTSCERHLATMLERDEAEGTHFHQSWHGMKATTPIISGGMNAVRLPAFLDNLGHDNVIQTSGGGVFGHRGGPAAGGRSIRQAVTAWRQGADLVEFAADHPELRDAFASFPEDSDRLYPHWREKLQVRAAELG